MTSSEGRRSFLLGVTLNELSFIMFFLLMFISASTLQKVNEQLKQETEKRIKLQAEIAKTVLDKDATFKRLQLLESRLNQAGDFSSKPSEEELTQLFNQLKNIRKKNNFSQTHARLRAEIKALQEYKQLVDDLKRNGFENNVLQQLTQLKQSAQELHTLKGRMIYMQKKLKNNGLDHPPCWVSAQNGAIEYLYTITLYEYQMEIEAAWPAYRQADLILIPGAEKLAGKNLDQSQLAYLVQPIFSWSKKHECRHFVRIKDDRNTSKQAFKQQMLVIENYFYKYLIR